jgi:hypothetical protein
MDKVHPERAGESGRKRTFAGGIEGLHVEDVNTLHLTQDLQSLETSGLLEIRGHGAGRGAGADEVLWLLDLCLRNKNISISALARDELTTASPKTKAQWHGVPRGIINAPSNFFSLLPMGLVVGVGPVASPAGVMCQCESSLSGRGIAAKGERTAHDGAREAALDDRGDRRSASSSECGALEEHGSGNWGVRIEE